MNERKPKFETLSGIEAKRVYTPDDAPQNYDAQLGMPGEYPFTRGIQATMYRGRFWTMRQYAGYASADESNARYKYLLAQFLQFVYHLLCLIFCFHFVLPEHYGERSLRDHATI